MVGGGQLHRDWSNYHRLDFEFFQSGKSFSQLNIFSPEGKIGNLGWPRSFGAIVIPGFKSSIPPFIHAIRNMDWAPTSTKGKSKEGSWRLGMYMCRGVLQFLIHREKKQYLLHPAIKNLSCLTTLSIAWNQFHYPFWRHSSFCSNLVRWPLGLLRGSQSKPPG